MNFMPRVVLVASNRQDKKDGWGTWCAKCCRNIDLAREYPVPRIPIAQGGNWKIENCVILCEDCFCKIGFNHPDEIPYSELSCLRV